MSAIFGTLYRLTTQILVTDQQIGPRGKDNVMTYKVPSPNVPISWIFRVLSVCSRQLDLEVSPFV